MLPHFSGYCGSASQAYLDLSAVFSPVQSQVKGRSITQPQKKTLFSEHQLRITGEPVMLLKTFMLLINNIRAVNEHDSSCSQLINPENSYSSHISSEQVTGMKLLALYPMKNIHQELALLLATLGRPTMPHLASLGHLRSLFSLKKEVPQCIIPLMLISLINVN